MVRVNQVVQHETKLRKSAHVSPSKEELQSKGAVHLSVVKTVEIELQKRGYLSLSTTGSFHPLWFLAETERNVFLWRAGCSLIQEDEFEFWVDVSSLIDRRIQSIQRGESDNPFSNASWGFAPLEDETKNDEIEYLSAFRELFNTIVDHANALCLVSQQILRELCPHSLDRHVVLLPYQRKQKL